MIDESEKHKDLVDAAPTAVWIWFVLGAVAVAGYSYFVLNFDP
jgi:hypothetical protein